MAFTKHFKLSSALLLGTLTAGTLMSEAAHGTDHVVKHLQQQVATAGGAHANLTKLKDAMTHPNLALAMPGAANSVGAALTAAAADATCSVGGAVPGGPAGPAMPLTNHREIINAIAALEAVAVPGDTPHRQAVRNALGLDGNNLGASQAEFNNFMHVANERLIHFPTAQAALLQHTRYLNSLHTAQADLNPGSGTPIEAMAVALPAAVPANAANAMPFATRRNRVAIFDAIEAAPLDGGVNDAAKLAFRTAINLPADPAHPDASHQEVVTYLRAAR